MEKNKFRIIITAILVLIVTGCEGLPSGFKRERHQFTLVPGDCAVTYYKSGVNGSDGVDRIEFRLYLLENTDIYNRVGTVSKKTGTIHFFPSEDVFKNYEGSVKNAFYNLSFNSEKNMEWCLPRAYYSTVFPIGPTSVTANKEFQGIPAGEELSSIMINSAPEYYSEPWDHPLRINNISDFNSDLETYHNLGFFYIKLPAPKIMEEETRFTVSIPVRRVKILQWLSDLTVSPESPMPYSDEVLSWTIDFKPFTFDEKGDLKWL